MESEAGDAADAAGASSLPGEGSDVPAEDWRASGHERDADSPARKSFDFVVISGMSGAGRSTAAKVLEDLGYYVVDNLPPTLIRTMADLGSKSQGAVTRIAVVMDLRSRAFSDDLREVIQDLDRHGYRPRVLFLDASDRILVRRFESSRRAHPLQGDARLIDGIHRERELLAGLREEADLIVDTTTLSVHDLRRQIEGSFEDGTATRLRATTLSFGFKYGVPPDADMVFDVRFLPNPFWIPDLREQTGKDAAVAEYVMEQPASPEFLDLATRLLKLVGAGYHREGKRYMLIAIGCTGGKHRSVAMAEEIGRRLAQDDVSVRVLHRDLGRE